MILKSMICENVGIGFLIEIVVYFEDYLVCFLFLDEV